VKRRKATIPYRGPQVKDLPAPLRCSVLQQLATPDPCLLCGQAARHVGVFVPHVPRRWGIPEGCQCAVELTHGLSPRGSPGVPLHIAGARPRTHAWKGGSVVRRLKKRTRRECNPTIKETDEAGV
jgi:hypothetical protein